MFRRLKIWRLKRKYTAKAMAESARIYAEIGMPERIAFKSLLYNRPTGTLIAEIYEHSSEVFARRLYGRRRDERAYRQIGSPSDDISFVNPVTSDTLALLVFSSSRCKKHKDGFVAGEWEALHRVDLNNWSVDEVASKKNVVLPQPYSRGWISNVLGIWSDGLGIDVVFGLEKPEKGRVDYFLSKLEFATRAVVPITKLESTFF